jgi:hypothetical protein
MNKIKDAFSKVKASEEFKNTLMKDLQSASFEKKPIRSRKHFKPLAVAAALLFVLVGAAGYKIATTSKPQEQVINSANPPKTIDVPKIELPTSGIAVKMMPLIVYNGKVYTMSTTVIDSESGKKLLGENLGTTQGNITEWSKQDQYSKEFASTVGIEDVYTAKGYDKAFRIMTYTENPDGSSYPQFFDCLNGITIKNGSDIFGKLNIKGNITDAKYRNFSDWNSGVEAVNPIKNLDSLNKFLSEVDKASPYLLEEIESTLGDYQNDEQYREITVSLNDGSKVSFTVLKNGYIYYGYTNTYFKLDGKIMEQLWSILN